MVILLTLGFIVSAGDFFKDRSLSGDFFIKFNFVYPGA